MCFNRACVYTTAVCVCIWYESKINVSTVSWPSVFLQKAKVPSYKRKECFQFSDLCSVVCVWLALKTCWMPLGYFIFVSFLFCFVFFCTVLAFLPVFVSVLWHFFVVSSFYHFCFRILVFFVIRLSVFRLECWFLFLSFVNYLFYFSFVLLWHFYLALFQVCLAFLFHVHPTYFPWHFSFFSQFCSYCSSLMYLFITAFLLFPSYCVRVLYLQSCDSSLSFAFMSVLTPVELYCHPLVPLWKHSTVRV